jgi:hypothetical protein
LIGSPGARADLPGGNVPLTNTEFNLLAAFLAAPQVSCCPVSSFRLLATT